MSNSIAIKSHTAVLNGLERVGQNTIATVMNVDNSTITHLKDGSNKVNFESLCRAFEAMGLKVVPSDVKCYRQEDIEEILSMAKKYMQIIDMTKLEF